MELKKGLILKSGNFELTDEVRDLGTLGVLLKTKKSIFIRHKMYPTSFIFSWSMRLCLQWIDRGWIWDTKQLNN